MKISKTTRWILTIGILAILLGGLGVNYRRQIAEQSQLTTDIAQAQQDFRKYDKYTAQYATEKEELETRLNQANSRLTSIQSRFSQYTKSIEINEVLFQAAEDANVTITKLTSSLPEEEKLNGISYRVFTLSITAKGEVVALLNFSNKISERFWTAAIESVKITVSEVEEGESEEKSTIDLRLKIYAYESE
jgi:predicted RNase H-like nuclease (RuvC/YqgF family)